MSRPARYTENSSNRDWIDEFCATSTLEEVRGAFRFTIGKCLRRYGKKDDRLQEALKIQDYANRLVECERSQVRPIVRELYSEADEKRMDVVGQNGPTAEHYMERCPVCNGAGMNPLTDVPVPCANCHGEGQYQDPFG